MLTIQEKRMDKLISKHAHKAIRFYKYRFMPKRNVLYFTRKDRAKKRIAFMNPLLGAPYRQTEERVVNMYNDSAKAMNFPSGTLVINNGGYKPLRQNISPGIGASPVRWAEYYGLRRPGRLTLLLLRKALSKNRVKWSLSAAVWQKHERTQKERDEFMYPIANSIFKRWEETYLRFPGESDADYVARLKSNIKNL